MKKIILILFTILYATIALAFAQIPATKGKQDRKGAVTKYDDKTISVIIYDEIIQGSDIIPANQKPQLYTEELLYHERQGWILLRDIYQAKIDEVNKVIKECQKLRVCK